MSTINVYGQFTFHDDASIVGDRAGLTLLRDAISQVLDSSLETSERIFNVYASDGEGYVFSVVCRDDARFPSPTYGFYDRIVDESVLSKAAHRRIANRAQESD